MLTARPPFLYCPPCPAGATLALQVTCLLVVNNALQGILSSFFYKYADTILKKYSSTIATIFTGRWVGGRGWVVTWVSLGGGLMAPAPAAVPGGPRSQPPFIPKRWLPLPCASTRRPARSPSTARPLQA
jgi:hypothetical protein